jgi:hypothetical protein
MTWVPTDLVRALKAHGVKPGYRAGAIGGDDAE